MKKMKLNNGKYRGLIGLTMESMWGEHYLMKPSLLLFIQIKSNGEWITLANSHLDFPLSLEDLSKEFERLIQRIENPTYEDEIMY